MDGFVASLERNSVIDSDFSTGLNNPIRFVRPVHNDPKLYLFSPAEMEKMMEDEDKK